MTARGEQLFQQLGCVSCHLTRRLRAAVRRSRASTAQQEQLATGAAVVVDDTYIRESILTPQAKLVAGYGPVMPTFQGQVNEAGIDEPDRVHQVAAVAGAAGGGDAGERAAARPRASKVRTHDDDSPPACELSERQHGVASWLLTKDHKRIGIMYLVVVTIAFFLGGIFAAGVRIELTTPQGDFVSADTYNRLFTMHGVLMVFFVLIPAVPAILGNFVLPLMIGAKDVAFPKINLLSWYVFVIGFIFTLAAMVVRRRRYRLDVLHALQLDGVELERDADRASASSSPASRRS